MKKTILVTGAGGFIPSYLIQLLLAKEYNVIGLDNGFGRALDSLIPFAQSSNFEFIKGDAGDKTILQKLHDKVDKVVAAHSLVGEPICNKYPDLAWSVNAESIKTITEIFGNKGIILTSTGSVYGKVENEASEDTKINPLSIYAKSKALAEQYASKNRSIIYRFATAFGIGTSSLRLDLLVNDFCYQAYRNKCLVVYQPEFRRTFCHVRDIAESLVHAIDNFDSMEGHIYNVGNSTGNITKRKLAELIASKTSCELFFGQSGYADTDQRDYESNFCKIHATGWKAQVSLEQGIDELLKIMPTIKTQNQYIFV